MHDGGLKAPPAPLSVNSTVPVGSLVELVVSAIVMVNELVDPDSTDKELGMIVTEVESGRGTDVLLLSINIKLLLSAVAEIKAPKGDSQLAAINKRAVKNRPVNSAKVVCQTLTIPLDTRYCIPFMKSPSEICP